MKEKCNQIIDEVYENYLKNRRIIKVEVPKEIWDADISIWNILRRRDIMGAWMKSIVSVVNQMKH